MKPFLGKETNNEHRNCMNYAIRCTSEQTQQEWNEVFSKKEAMLSKSKLTRFFYYLSLCLLVVGITTFMQTLTFLNDIANGSEIFFFNLNLFVSILCFSIYFIIKNRYKTQHKILVEMANKSNLNIRRELEIPDEVGFTEVIYYEYEIHDGEVVPVPKQPGGPIYFNPLYFLYIENEKLNIGTDKHVFAVPLSALKCIRKVEQKISFRFWKKPEHFSSPAYKDFDIIATKNSIETDYYYSLELCLGREVWEIPFPCYELPVFEKLTGLSVTSE